MLIELSAFEAEGENRLNMSRIERDGMEAFEDWREEILTFEKK